MKYRAVLFDMDGTILDTVADLNASINYALEKCGHRHDFTLEDTKRLFGSGVHTAIQRALSMESGHDEESFLIRIGTPEYMTVPGIDENEVAAIEQIFRPYYLEHSLDRTGPYDGIPELLSSLRSLGLTTAVLSNKPDPAVRKLADDIFPGLFDAAAGERPGIRRKPAPDMTQAMLAELGLLAGEALYIGDSEVDVETAAASGLDCVCVSWGFRSRTFLEALHPLAVIDRAKDLIPLL